MIFLRSILKYLPFRLNFFVQERFIRKGILFEGMNEAQRRIVFEKFVQKNPPKCHSYGPPFEPPWVVFPDYPRYSMGFRMGGGEDYIMQFRDWYTSASQYDIKSFQNTYPETDEYLGFYAQWDKP